MFVCLETGYSSNSEHTEMHSTGIERHKSDKDFLEQASDSSVLARTVQQLPKDKVDEIDQLIKSKKTAAIIISTDDDNISNTLSATTTDPNTEMRTATSNNATTTEPASKKSAFITESPMKIAVSYSGKERKRVLNITRILRDQMNASNNPDSVFFDGDFQHEICRINGLSHLQNIYSQAHLVIVFLSPTYTDSRYCTGEWRTIADRFLSNKQNKEATQLLLIKLGEYDMKQLDLVNNDFAVNGLRMNDKEIANLIVRRWEIIEKNLEQNKQ